MNTRPQPQSGPTALRPSRPFSQLRRALQSGHSSCSACKSKMHPSALNDAALREQQCLLHRTVPASFRTRTAKRRRDGHAAPRRSRSARSRRQATGPAMPLILGATRAGTRHRTVEPRPGFSCGRFVGIAESPARSTPLSNKPRRSGGPRPPLRARSATALGRGPAPPRTGRLAASSSAQNLRPSGMDGSTSYRRSRARCFHCRPSARRRTVRTASGSGGALSPAGPSSRSA